MSFDDDYGRCEPPTREDRVESQLYWMKRGWRPNRDGKVRLHDMDEPYLMNCCRKYKDEILGDYFLMEIEKRGISVREVENNVSDEGRPKRELPKPGSLRW